VASSGGSGGRWVSGFIWAILLQALTPIFDPQFSDWELTVLRQSPLTIGLCPLDKQEKATETVLEQSEVLCETWNST
jgi:hypothetical protein